MLYSFITFAFLSFWQVYVYRMSFLQIGGAVQRHEDIIITNYRTLFVQKGMGMGTIDRDVVTFFLGPRNICNILGPIFGQ